MNNNSIERICPDAYNAAVNILAVEFLVKERAIEKYSRYIKILYTFDTLDLLCLDISLSFNKHISNLGAMITQGDYDSQRDILFAALKEKQEKGYYLGY